MLLKQPIILFRLASFYFITDEISQNFNLICYNGKVPPLIDGMVTQVLDSIW